MSLGLGFTDTQTHHVIAIPLTSPIPMHHADNPAAKRRDGLCCLNMVLCTPSDASSYWLIDWLLFVWCHLSDLLLLGRIACIAWHRCGLLQQTSHVAWFVCLCVWWSRECTVQKRLNRSRCRFEAWLLWVQGIIHEVGVRLDESIHSRKGWQVGDAAFCQITFDTCYCCY